MKDPYSVLGVSPQASDEQVKKAYRDLARKYHPDNYQNNPLADLAQEKMKEINEAYDSINRMRGDGASGYSAGSDAASASGYSSGYSTGNLAQVRTAINTGNLAYAEQLLNSETNRGAEWNFLMGSLYYRRGWADRARLYFQRAVSMEPNNPEYAQALRSTSSGQNFYRQNNYGGSGASDAANCCSSLILADCCCECMGGDLIGCC